MKYKQRLWTALAFAVSCCFLLIVLPFVVDQGFLLPQPQLKTGIGQTLLRRGAAAMYRSADAHLTFMRKDLDLSNYTGDNPPHDNSPEVDTLLSNDDNSKTGDINPLDNEAQNVITSRPLSSKGNNEDEYKSDKEKDIVSYLSELLLDDDTFLREQNLEDLLYMVDLIKQRAKNSKNGILTKQEMFSELRARLVDEGILIATEAVPTPPPELKNTSLINITSQEWTILRKVQPNLFAKNRRRHKKRGPQLNLYPQPRNRQYFPWEKFHNSISQFELYSDTGPVVEDVLEELRTQPIVDCLMKAGGTQMKLTFYFENGARTMFKPMRFPRNQETLPNHFYFTDYERFNAEIAAFHLDRILGFKRVPPHTGRIVNTTHDIKRLADSDLLRTFFISPAGNVCFHGSCDYYCDTSHAVCGHPDLLEGSFAVYLPSTNIVDRKTWRHPWRRSYHKRKKAEWEVDNLYCNKVRRKHPYNTGRRLLDLMDMTVFDFLMGNLDRHHYETFLDFGNYTYPLHLDNGRGFGKTQHDEISALAPIYQCCLIRYTTLEKLMSFASPDSQSLGAAMKESLYSDPVDPVLTNAHFEALDRRNAIILKTVTKCIEKNIHYSRVVVDDGF